MTAYDDAHLQRTFAEDGDIAELGIEVLSDDDRTVLRGHVESPQRRDAIEARVRAGDPDREVVNEITVVPAERPTDVEELA